MRLGLVIPGSRGLETAAGTARWLREGATEVGCILEVADLSAPDRAQDGYVLLVGQYGPVAAPAVTALVEQYSATWSGRAVGLVAYGGASRGRRAADQIRGTLSAHGAVVIDHALGINVAELRGRGGPTEFDRLVWRTAVESLVRACRRRSSRE